MRIINETRTHELIAAGDARVVGLEQVRGIDVRSPFGGLLFERHTPHAVLVTNRGAEEEIPIENEGIFTRLAPYALAPAAALALRQIIRWKGRR